MKIYLKHTYISSLGDMCMLLRGILLIAVFMSLPATSCLAAETLNMGYFNLPPHQYVAKEAKHKVEGVSIRYFEKLAHAMGYSVNWVGPLPLPRLTQRLKTDNYLDGTVGFPKYPSFESFLFYTDIPVYLGQPTFVLLKSNPLNRIETIGDIKNYRIGLVKSASGKYTPLIDENRNVLHVEELGGDTWIRQNIVKLLHGRLDALFDRQQYSIPYVAAKLGSEDRIKIISAPAPPTPMFIVFSKCSKRGKILVEQCNQALRTIGFDYSGEAAKQIKQE